MSAAQSAGVRLLVRLLPAGDRDAIVGDLLEDAAYRDITGARLHLWLLRECGTIAAGLSVARLRGWVVVPPVRELATGLAVDRRGAFRDTGAFVSVVRALIFCGSVATLAFGVEILVATLLSASGFGR